MNEFYTWLLSQSGRNDIISDLASDVRQDSSFPLDSDNFTSLREYLENKGACPGALEALDEAWREFVEINTIKI
ncbi:sterile alpha motif-like domain-containing protein [Thalassotalea fonticola]|uniref:Sterile alpha motif-like domain-containing protein n=1 Tax=Thalassotalea fonticola TaxID=3065649 RepID=A0ABZ0GP28_9GAMM|nr:sterile alpha motif-like domain-containing protein [Colwelliaceae bacterium S1-1]WOH37664.1 sterile alpha motif-like domain-containing protein [Colwelliaceae bacterium S1-1]